MERIDNVDSENPIHVEKKKYEQRQLDGILAINELMAELRLNSIENELPREVNRSIEHAFEKVTNAILIGWWVTAKEECEEVIVGGYVTQELWDRIYNTINQYISENY